MATPHFANILTVAAIREAKDGEEVRFYERERALGVNRDLPGAGSLLESLHEGLKSRRPVVASVDEERGVVTAVDRATPELLELLARERPLLDDPQRIAKIDLTRIDPLRFNIVERYLDWPVFHLCRRTIPGWAKAQEIFDYCAELSCHLPGPPAVAPCIPFQYVRDGCYARAHQMRRLIVGQWGYCVDKVFSFATAGNDTLAVKADKWGGCCVTWWYHVAPLVRVQVRVRGFRHLPPISLTLAMVIDPGMFDKPMLLSTWLAAQENTACHPNAHVTSYSIQPGSSYTPYYGGGFTTDPNYVQTEQTLVAYRNLTTC